MFVCLGSLAEFAPQHFGWSLIPVARALRFAAEALDMHIEDQACKDSSSEKPRTEARWLITAARSATASTWFTLRRGGAHVLAQQPLGKFKWCFCSWRRFVDPFWVQSEGGDA